ncbi:MAG: hypothetical protein Q9162_006245 [Coniocarpon cinnabarinum]
MDATLCEFSLVNSIDSKADATALNINHAPTLNPGLSQRAIPNAPNGYAPASVPCPATRPSVRNADELSEQESQWLSTRRNSTIDPMIDLLNRINIPDFDGANYISSNQHNTSALPNIGIAISGGGYRALLNGAGVIEAFDDRTDNTTAPGQLGGLLQSATYLAGLSGGSWLVASLFANNYTSVQDILNAPDGDTWDFSNSIYQGPGGIPGLSELEYYHDVQDAVSAKDDAPYDFNISVTDYWGRALSYQLVNDTDGGISYTYSSIAQQDFFTNGSTPLPILVSDERDPGTILIPSNTTVFEFNPWEFGSWDPTLYAFAPLQYAGSNFTNGQLPTDEPCIAGFDNVGYVMGTSSTLFNEFFLEFNTTAGSSVPQFIKDAVNAILNKTTTTNNDIADWTPNPFRGVHSDTNPNHDSTSLTLVDGGEDLQNIPLHPLIQPNRHVDVVFAIDSSADTNSSYPNGTAMVATYQRFGGRIGNGTAFPYIPDVQTFVNLGLNSRPTFFGCDAANYSRPDAPWPGPLIVYLPNAHYVVDSGIGTFQDSYNTSQRNALIANGYALATQGNGTLDANWDVCIGCAMLQRSLVRTGTPVPSACADCFGRYCWDGSLNTTASNYSATPRLGPSDAVDISAASSRQRGMGSLLALVVAVAVWVGVL